MDSYSNHPITNTRMMAHASSLPNLAVDIVKSRQLADSNTSSRLHLRKHYQTPQLQEFNKFAELVDQRARQQEEKIKIIK